MGITGVSIRLLPTKKSFRPWCDGVTQPELCGVAYFDLIQNGPVVEMNTIAQFNK